jgi:hypothetical protein
MDTSLFFKVSVHIARAGTPVAEAFETERSHSSEDLFEKYSLLEAIRKPSRT